MEGFRGANIWSVLLIAEELLSPGADSDALMADGCLDDHNVDRSGDLLDMDDALTSEGSLLLDTGAGDLGDLRDPDMDDCNRSIRYSNAETLEDQILC